MGLGIVTLYWTLRGMINQSIFKVEANSVLHIKTPVK